MKLIPFQASARESLLALLPAAESLPSIRARHGYTKFCEQSNYALQRVARRLGRGVRMGSPRRATAERER